MSETQTRELLRDVGLFFEHLPYVVFVLVVVVPAVLLANGLRTVWGWLHG
jgi:hypothetical protein